MGVGQSIFQDIAEIIQSTDVSGYQKAAELTLTGRKVSASEALELGLILKLSQMKLNSRM